MSQIENHMVLPYPEPEECYIEDDDHECTDECFDDELDAFDEDGADEERHEEEE